MEYEGDGSPDDILEWLNEGGYSCVLEWNGERHAYVQDEDDDVGPQRVPVRAVRRLVKAGKIAIWRDLHSAYKTYRPTAWVEAWNRGERPWSDGRAS